MNAADNFFVRYGDRPVNVVGCEMRGARACCRPCTAEPALWAVVKYEARAALRALRSVECPVACNKHTTNDVVSVALRLRAGKSQPGPGMYSNVGAGPCVGR